MTLNIAPAHLNSLGNNIYKRKNSSTKIYLFKVNNRNPSKLTVKTPEQLFSYFFSSVFTVDFEQVNVCWVSTNDFINADVTYCCNY